MAIVFIILYPIFGGGILSHQVFASLHIYSGYVSADNFANVMTHDLSGFDQQLPSDMYHDSFSVS